MRLGSGNSAVVAGRATHYDRYHCTDGLRISIVANDSNVHLLLLEKLVLTGEASAPQEDRNYRPGTPAWFEAMFHSPAPHSDAHHYTVNLEAPGVL
jgi:hypothetical protein